MNTTTAGQRGLRITLEGGITPITVRDGDEIRAAIGCDAVDVISVEHRIDLWVDDEGLLVAEPLLNLTATVLAHSLGAATAVFGTAVVLSVDPTTGETLGLSDRQLAQAIRAVEAPDRSTLTAVARTLSVLMTPHRA